MRSLLPLLALACAPEVDAPTDAVDTDLPIACVPEVPEALTAHVGPQEDGSFLHTDGRVATAPGARTVLEGFPSDVTLHPTVPVAYVTSTSADDRRLYVVDLDTGAILQDLVRPSALWGLLLSPDASTLYAAGGAGQTLGVFPVDEAGLLSTPNEVPTGQYASGLALSPDGALVWVGAFTGGDVVEIDTTTLEITQRIPVSTGVYDLVYLPGRDELYASDLAGRTIAVIDVGAGAEVAQIDADVTSAGLAASAAGDRVYVALSNGDALAEIDPIAREIAVLAAVADTALVDDQGLPLGNSNPTGLWLDEPGNRVYVTRAADHAISVFDLATLELLGAIPSGAYPTDVEVLGDRLVIAEGKGDGAGANEGASASRRNRGSVSVVDLAELDLALTTEDVRRNFARPIDLFDFSCDGEFPVPDVAGEPTPIEHVVLIVKENKTFDCLLGDLEGAVGDPSLLRWGPTLTPNLRALVSRFSLSDNFYTQVEESDNGHLFLTSGHLPDYAERAFLEQSWSSEFFTFPLADASVPRMGNFFTHLLDNGKSIRTFGEIVGMFVEPKVFDGLPSQFSDIEYPGGPFYNTGVEDELKALHVAMRVETEGLADFTYVLIPNDHTVGTSPGAPTPDSMVADNDYALGILVDAISHSPYWDKTLILVLQDDAQGCEDSIDAHRSPLLAISPWAKRGYISHAHASFLSVFATIERVLDLPPMGRQDATAAPLWDLFTQTPDFTPYARIERLHPKELNEASTLGAQASSRMDFSGPDRSPDLAIVLDAWRLWKMGAVDEAEAERRIRDRVIDPKRYAALEEEAEEDGTAFDADMQRLQAWAEERGLQLPPRPGRDGGYPLPGAR